jgi:SAM-dependent methyltransferase
MNTAGLDWDALERLRARFLAGATTCRGYWESEGDLAAYDATFAERIGWKWDAVLRRLAEQQWSPPPGALVDFGCGSGVAGRRVLGAFPGRFTVLHCVDRSPLAERFAAARAAGVSPSAAVRRGPPTQPGLPFTLVLSHVVNELDGAGRREVTSLVRRAAAVLWVEPGAKAEARALMEWRARILGEGRHHVVAPCTHRGACGLLAAGSERHWCHFFADPPKGLAMDGEWARFARRAGIDVRTTPYSYLVLDGAQPFGSEMVEDVERVIGSVRSLKAEVRFMSCGSEGVRELRLQRRTDAGLAAYLAETRETPRMVWQSASGEVIRGEGLGGDGESNGRAPKDGEKTY